MAFEYKVQVVTKFRALLLMGMQKTSTSARQWWKQRKSFIVEINHTILSAVSGVPSSDIFKK